MSIDKALASAPLGLSNTDPTADSPDDPIIEIEIPGDTETPAEDDLPPGFSDNLAEYIAEPDLESLASELVSDYEDDIASRKDWIQTYVDGLELLGVKIEERAEPWEGACGVYHPLLAEAVVKFQSETMMATFPAAGPVKTKVVGKETPEKKESAARVQEDMNYQLTDVMKEFRPEHERMLWGLGLAGNAFKKVYFDPRLNRQVSMFVPAEDLVVPYGASDLASSERVTHVMRKTENEIKRLQHAEFYRDIDLGPPDNVLDEVEKKIAERLGFRATSDNRYKLLEMGVYIDPPKMAHKVEGEDIGIQLPYIVTIEKGANKVLAIRRNWDPTKDTYEARQHFVHYGYVPGFGFYCFGLIHLIGAFAKSGTSIIRQLVDAGTLSNLPGGFKTRGMRVKGDDTPISPGEWRDVDIPSGTLRDNLMPLPYKEPSQVLAALMDKIMEDGRRFANTADLSMSDMSAQAPVGTTLAILERTLKNMSAIQARIYYSMKQELGLLKEIIADYAPEDYDYDPDVGSRMAKKSDYKNTDVIPVADPNAATMAQRIVQMQAVWQMTQGDSSGYNMPLLKRQMLEVLGIRNADKLVPMDDDLKPLDPVSENQNILMMQPVKAFLYQDHQAHITVHMSAMQDPKIQSLLQNNPQAQLMQQAMMAHINEHLGFEYRRQIEMQLGIPLPAQKDEEGDDNVMSPEVEARLSPLLAQAAQRLLQQNTQEIAQQQAQQQAQDPLVQLQQQEVAIKEAEQKRKVQKDQTDAELKSQQLDIERRRIETQKAIDQQRIKVDIAKTVAQSEQDRGKLLADISTDVLKHLSNKSHDKAGRDQQERQQVRQLNSSTNKGSNE